MDRIDPITNINIDAAIRSGDNVALYRVELAQLEAMVQDDYIVATIKIVRRRITRELKKAQ